MLTQQEFFSELSRIFRENGLGGQLNRQKADAFFALTVRMLEENEKYNLTAITDPQKIILQHYADCAVLAARLPKGCRMLDVGCGAGFPSLPVAILRPDVSVTAVDSTAKRTAYVEGCGNLLALSGLRVLTLRAEEGAADPALRETFDVVTARAVAEMRVLAELCLPYVKVGGELLAMKGKNAAFELAGAKRAIAILGGRNPKIEEITLRDSRGETLSHPIVTVEKTAKTPASYPRPFAQISKKPL